MSLSACFCVRFYISVRVYFYALSDWLPRKLSPIFCVSFGYQWRSFSAAKNEFFCLFFLSYSFLSNQTKHEWKIPFCRILNLVPREHEILYSLGFLFVFFFGLFGYILYFGDADINVYSD